jgi:uncharacterized protein YecE (DUF72 family)
MIKIGTSGYSFKDWKGNFYPEQIQDGKMLDYYKDYFDTVEINSTYYRIQEPKIFFYLDKKTPENFHFIVKVNQETTHKRKKNKESIEQLIKSLDSIIKSNKLKGLLAQFPYSFRFNRDNLKYIGETQTFCKEIPLIVEFRHTSWLQNEVYDFFSEKNITYVCVDEPKLDYLLPKQDTCTSETGYIRFHGRNATNWYDTSKGDRYDYLYTEDELKEWLDIIRKMKDKTKILYLFFNNCHHGSASLNASMMKKILRLM